MEYSKSYHTTFMHESRLETGSTSVRLESLFSEAKQNCQFFVMLVTNSKNRVIDRLENIKAFIFYVFTMT